MFDDAADARVIQAEANVATRTVRARNCGLFINLKLDRGDIKICWTASKMEVSIDRYHMMQHLPEPRYTEMMERWLESWYMLERSTEVAYVTKSEDIKKPSDTKKFKSSKQEYKTSKKFHNTKSEKVAVSTDKKTGKCKIFEQDSH